ncbi:MAG: hypothetical protein WCN98_05535 [Verrucomicrobiaceae bacterium]
MNLILFKNSTPPASALPATGASGVSAARALETTSNYEENIAHDSHDRVNSTSTGD